MLHCRKRRHHSKDVAPHKCTAEHLNLFDAKLPSSHVTDHLCRAEHRVGVLTRRCQHATWRGRRHRLVSASYDEVYVERFSINRFYANRIRAVIQNRSIILMSCLRCPSNIVLVCECIVEVIEHDECWWVTVFTRDLFDFLRNSIARDDIRIICGDFAHRCLGVFDGEKLGVVSESRDQDRVTFVNKCQTNGLKRTSCPRRNTRFIHAEEPSEIVVELCDGWLGDFIESKWFTTLITRRVTVAVNDERLHRLRGQTACGLDRLDVDVALLDFSDRYVPRDFHF